MRISKQTKKTTLAQQGRYLLICLLSMLLLFLAGSVLILNRTQRQVYEQLEEISKLYTDELDNRFFRISRNLFSTVMDSSNPDSAFWKYMDLMEKDQYEEYVITQLRRNYVSAAWDFGTDYNVFLYTQKDDSLYQLSISSDRNADHSRSESVALPLRAGARAAVLHAGGNACRSAECRF